MTKPIRLQEFTAPTFKINVKKTEEVLDARKFYTTSKIKAHLP